MGNKQDRGKLLYSDSKEFAFEKLRYRIFIALLFAIVIILLSCIIYLQFLYFISTYKSLFCVILLIIFTFILLIGLFTLFYISFPRPLKIYENGIQPPGRPSFIPYSRIKSITKKEIIAINKEGIEIIALGNYAINIMKKDEKLPLLNFSVLNGFTTSTEDYDKVYNILIKQFKKTRPQ